MDIRDKRIHEINDYWTVETETGEFEVASMCGGHCMEQCADKLGVLKSAAGFYVGRFYDEGPLCRVTGYVKDRETADSMLAAIRKSVEEGSWV